MNNEEIAKKNVKGCGKPFQKVFMEAIDPDDYLICGFSKIGEDVQFCQTCQEKVKVHKKECERDLEGEFPNAIISHCNDIKEAIKIYRDWT